MVRTVFLEPFYEYLDEHIDDQQAILYFLRQYKHRCEWFQAERLRRAIEEDTQKGEKSLAFDLYEFLHQQGIDFHIEPYSASGIADFVTDQVGEDRVVADAKVFWPEKGKGKSYLIAAFHQAYTYSRDYNEPASFLVIFKMCKEDVNFLVPASQTMFPCLTLNNKTIFFRRRGHLRARRPGKQTWPTQKRGHRLKGAYPECRIRKIEGFISSAPLRLLSR